MRHLKRALAVLGIAFVLAFGTAVITYYMDLWDVSSLMVSCNDEPTPEICTTR